MRRTFCRGNSKRSVVGGETVVTTVSSVQSPRTREGVGSVGISSSSNVAGGLNISLECVKKVESVPGAVLLLKLSQHGTSDGNGRKRHVPSFNSHKRAKAYDGTASGWVKWLH